MRTIRIFSMTFVAVILCHLGAGAQDFLKDPRYGPDEATRKTVVQYLNMMGDAIKVNNTEGVIGYASEIVRLAPTASKNAYIVLQNSYRARIARAKTVAEKNLMVDSLMYYYDVRSKAYPEDINDIYARRAQDYKKYRPMDTQNVIKYFEQAVDIAGKDIEPTFVVFSFAVFVEGYQNDAVKTEDLLAAFDKLMSTVEDESSEEKVEAKKCIEQLLITSGAANCANLEKLFKPKYEATPDDVDLLQKITKYLTREKCDTPFRLLVTEHYYKLSPSPENALLLSGMYEDKGDMNKAIYYLRKAVNEETDAQRKGTYLVRAAATTLSSKNAKEASEFAKMALQINNYNGLAYLVLAQAYANGSETACSDFDRQTVYWLVVDNLTKARECYANDTKQINSIDAQINTYKSNFPNSEECFFRGVNDGSSFDVNCGWIKGRTTVRIRK